MGPGSRDCPDGVGIDGVEVEGDFGASDAPTNTTFLGLVLAPQEPYGTWGGLTSLNARSRTEDVSLWIRRCRALPPCDQRWVRARS